MSTCRRHSLSGLLLPLIATLFAFAPLRAETIAFDSERWDLSRAQRVEHLGRPALAGTAFLKDLALRDGVVEVDVAITAGTRSYPGLLFRVHDAGNYERVYVRPHRSPFYDDVLQYGPVFQGVDSWQLYNGPGLTAGLEVPAERWNHLRVEIAGTRARVFWNEQPEPALDIDELVHGGGAGTLGLAGPTDGSAYFSNLRFEAREGFELPPAAPRTSAPGQISGWELSKPFPVVGVDFTAYPGRAVAAASWVPVALDARGLVDVSRTFARGSRAGDAILARTVLHAEAASLLHVALAYSDVVTVFLNRRPLFSGTASYQSRDRSFLGIVGFLDELYLPLAAGDNELLLLVGELSGGWAFGLRRADEIFRAAALSERWSRSEGLALPEAVVCPPTEVVCYVSNYFHDGEEYLAKVSRAGELLESRWVSGLRGPTGMTFADGTLWAVDRAGIHVLDTATGEERETVPLPGVRMANDIARDRAGNLYVSDTAAGIVYRIAQGRLEPWVEQLVRPNALLAEPHRLLIGEDEMLLAVDLESRAVTELARFDRGSNLDGLTPDGHGGYLVGDHNGRLFRLSASGERTLLLDSTNPGRRIADFDYLPAAGLLVVPTFEANSLVAYGLE